MAWPIRAFPQPAWLLDLGIAIQTTDATQQRQVAIPLCKGGSHCKSLRSRLGTSSIRLVSTLRFNRSSFSTRSNSRRITV